MAMRISEMWRWDGTIGRARYALIGAGAFAVKFVVDRFVAVEVFHRGWLPWNYVVFPWRPNVIGNAPAKPWLQTAGSNDAQFVAAMLLIALPFIWLGVTLTVQRLRDAGQPLWLVVLFFVAGGNVLFL